MTRLASILGVATVATLVLLSGCEQAVKTDYAKKLAGTWMIDAIQGTVDRPEAAFAMALPEQHINVLRAVAVVIEDGAGNHEGTFTLTVTTSPTDATDIDVLKVASITNIVTTASGTINVKNNSEMTVTITSDITNVPSAFPPPSDATDFKNTPLAASYELTGNELKLTSAILLALEVVMTPSEKLTLTKQ